MDTRELISVLVDRIQRTASVRAVFGEPVREGDRVIIPVARVMVRGGGGGGGSEASPDEADSPDTRGHGKGIGLGLNMVASPVGYIEIAPDGPRFVPILDRNRLLIAGLGLLGLTFWMVKAGVKMSRR